MGFWDFFSNDSTGQKPGRVKPKAGDKSRVHIAGGLDSRSDLVATDAIVKGDAETLARLGLGPDVMLRNGETLATFAWKTQSANHENYGDTCKEFQNDDDGFHDRVEFIASLSVGWRTPQNDPDYYLRACARLSSLAMLNALGISSDQWPRTLIDDLFFRPWDEYFPDLSAAFQRCEKGALVLRTIRADTAKQPNEYGEAPGDIAYACERMAERQTIPVSRTTNMLAKASVFFAAVGSRADAQEFTAYAQDALLRKTFPWLKIYRPTEKEFLALFALDQIFEDEKKLVLFAHRVGFYHWQTKRRTLDVEKILATARLETRR